MKRIGWIDVAKGIGVILVVLGHMPTVPRILRLWIFSFHMPLFFFVSGYLFKPSTTSTPFGTVLCSKAKKLLLPYLIYSIVFLSVDALLLRIGIENIYARLWRTLFGQGGYDILWFFFSLFLVETIYSIIERYSIKPHMWLAFLVICGLILSYYEFALQWKISTSMVALFFYSTGRFFRQIEQCYAEYIKRQIIILSSLVLNIVIFIICYNTNGIAVDMNNAKFTLGLVSLIGAVAGIVFVYGVGTYINEWKIIFPLKYIGRYSVFFFPLTAYVPNLIVDFIELHSYATIAIKIGSKVVGFVFAAMVSYIFTIRKRRTSTNVFNGCNKRGV